MLTAGLVAMSPAWSSSTTSTSVRRSSAASRRARVGVRLTPAGLWARGCRYTRDRIVGEAGLQRRPA